MCPHRRIHGGADIILNLLLSSKLFPEIEEAEFLIWSSASFFVPLFSPQKPTGTWAKVHILLDSWCIVR